MNREHLKERIDKHKAGIGAKWTKNGKGLEVVRLFKDATYEDELKIKSLGGVNFCPHCSKFMKTASVKGGAIEPTAKIV